MRTGLEQRDAPSDETAYIPIRLVRGLNTLVFANFGFGIFADAIMLLTGT